MARRRKLESLKDNQFSSQGKEIGNTLVSSAKKLGCRFIHFEVFANNSTTKAFYLNLGFTPDILHMIKEIS